MKVIWSGSTTFLFAAPFLPLFRVNRAPGGQLFWNNLPVEFVPGPTMLCRSSVICLHEMVGCV